MTTTHEIEVYVRFCETDAVGHVNNTSHFLYLEEARTKLFKILYPNRSSSLSFLIVSIQCDYVAQAYADETLKVASHVSKIGTKSFTISQILSNANTGKIIATASAVMVCYSHVEEKTVIIPPDLRMNLEEHLFAK
ncbi:acyl-CoA thioester hydrolase [Salirhabdus euzebyi]|uniref:Acyl-CoA thioester hydrolase n=1 Tax=Salirhabdus euzebyi TaxID=394506 RepID=A0A841PZ14_9BACI|nr:acyl-CoA thioesterase [Salirhabdus euzebyi]MBB6452451.1 acyl-CoA thioester hydrolase [Salirhabdus euzebyi]